MPSFFRAAALLALAAALLLLPGCATSDADLNYQRDQPANSSSGDHSYHGWNDANY